jgi:hypothetical protein
VSINESSSAYVVSLGTWATPAQTAEIKRLFDDIGLEAEVTADFEVRSTVAVTVMYLIGSGVAAAWIKAAAKFGENVGGTLGEYAGERIKNWLERVRGTRDQEAPIVIQDPSLSAQIVVTGYEPAEALEQLKDLIENDQIAQIPGKAGEIRYREGQGWIRPFRSTRPPALLNRESPFLLRGLPVVRVGITTDSGTAGRLARIRARLAPACGGRGSVRGAFGNVRSGNAADQAIDEAFAAAPYLLGPRELLDVGAHQGAAAQRDGHRIRIGCLVELA